MIRFLDTSVIVASVQAEHVHYSRSLPLMVAATPDESFCSTQTIAEFYATLTRLPLPLRQPPERAVLLVGALRRRVSFISLTADEYYETVQRLSALRIPGAQIYDALLLAAARKVKADVIYTWNLKHFRAVAPDLADRILEPGS